MSPRARRIAFIISVDIRFTMFMPTPTTYRKTACRTAAPPQRNGKRPASARSARARASRESSFNHSLHHRGVTAGTRKQLAPPWGHRPCRKTACSTMWPPPLPENSLHHRETTACYRKPACTTARPPPLSRKHFAPPRGRQKNAAGTEVHRCNNCFFRLRFPFSL